jgi:hypothetical protein
MTTLAGVGCRLPRQRQSFSDQDEASGSSPRRPTEYPGQAGSQQLANVMDTTVVIPLSHHHRYRRYCVKAAHVAGVRVAKRAAQCPQQRNRPIRNLILYRAGR